MRLIFFILSFFSFTGAVQVTFIVDMSEETVVAGEGNYPAVYVSGSNLNGPSGIEMTDNGDGSWSITFVPETYYAYFESQNNFLVNDSLYINPTTAKASKIT